MVKDVREQAPEDARTEHRGHDVFVSYSRADRDRVVELTQTLASRGKRAWVDLEDIPPSAEWMAEIRSAIDAADGYLVAVSPDAARSKVCTEELEHARSAGKRIVPVLLRPTDPDSVPQALAALNWIDATDGSIEEAADRIVQALDTDLDHVKAHTRLLVRASEWDGRSQARSLLLRGEDLRAAEALLVAAQGKEPAPTPVQARYVQASRQGTSRRQRAAVAIALCVALVAAALGVFAWQQRGEAIDQRAAAELQRQRAEEQAAISKSRELASASTTQLGIDPELGLLLGIEAARAATTPEAESALREALLASNHVATLVGHENPVVNASFSRDGERVLTTSYWAEGYVPQGDTGDVTTRIWDVASGDAIASIDLGRSSQPHSEFSPNGDLVLSSRAMTPFVSDPSSGATIRDFRELGDGIAHFDPTGTMVVGTCRQDSACVVDATTGDLLRTLRPAGASVREAVFTPDGSSIVAISSRDGWVWDAASGRLIHRLETPWASKWLAVSGDGSRVMIANLSHVGVWSLRTGKVVRFLNIAPRLNAYPQPMEPAIDAEGKRIASMDEHGTVTVWSASTGESLSTLPVSPARDVEFSPSGRWVLTASEDHTAAIWDADTGETVTEFLGTPGHLWLGRFSADGASVVTAGSDLTARLWVVDPGAAEALYTAQPGGDGQAAAFSSDGDVVFTGGYAGLVRGWDLGTDEVVRTYTAFPTSTRRYRDWVWSVDVSPDGSLLAVSGTGRMIRVFDTTSGEVISTLRFSPGEGPGAPGAADALAGVTWAVEFSPDGALLASASQDGVARLWDPANGDLVSKLEGHDAAVDFIAFDPTGSRLITGSDDGTARIWDVESGASLDSLEGQPQGVTSVAWSPDGSLLATTSYDATVFLRDASTGEILHRLTGSSGVVLAAEFSPDSRWLATTSDEDGALRIWDTADGRLIDLHRGLLNSTGYTVDFSPDGELVVIPGYTGPFGSGTGESLVYRCNLCVGLDGLVELAEQRVTRSFTDEERQRFLHEG